MSFFAVFCSRRLLSTSVDFGAQMKALNDAGQFRKTIALFEVQVKQQQRPTTLAVNQALKACIELGDARRGAEIHRSLSTSLANNSFIQTSLIRLYSKWLYEKENVILTLSL